MGAIISAVLARVPTSLFEVRHFLAQTSSVCRILLVFAGRRFMLAILHVCMCMTPGIVVCPQVTVPALPGGKALLLQLV